MYRFLSYIIFIFILGCSSFGANKGLLKCNNFEKYNGGILYNKELKIIEKERILFIYVKKLANEKDKVVIEEMIKRIDVCIEHKFLSMCNKKYFLNNIDIVKKYLEVENE